MSKYTRFEVIESDTIDKFNLVLIYDDEFADSQSEIGVREIRTVFKKVKGLLKNGKKDIPSFLIPIDCIPKEIYDFDTIDEAVKQGESIVSSNKQKVVYSSNKNLPKSDSSSTIDMNMKELTCEKCYDNICREYNRREQEQLKQQELNNKITINYGNRKRTI